MSWRVNRELALLRDNYTCQECGGKDNLEVHHIKYRASGHKLENLVTLCYHCHSLKHPINRRGYLISIGVITGKKTRRSSNKEAIKKLKARAYEKEADRLSRGKNGKCIITKCG